VEVGVGLGGWLVLCVGRCSAEFRLKGWDG